MTTIIFSPHQDDETLACGGTIAKKIMRGANVYIIFMTDGRNSHKTVLGIESNPTPEELKAIRKSESKKVAKIFGVKRENVIFLDFRDGTLKDNISRAKEFVKNCLIKLKPTEIFLPQEHDFHKDHSSTNQIVLTIAKELGLDIDVYEYIVWPNNNEEIKDYSKSVHFVEFDISDVIELKMKAISTYKSQTGIIFSSQNRPVLDDTFLSKFQKSKEFFMKYKLKNGKRVM